MRMGGDPNVVMDKNMGDTNREMMKIENKRYNDVLPSNGEFTFKSMDRTLV